MMRFASASTMLAASALALSLVSAPGIGSAQTPSAAAPSAQATAAVVVDGSGDPARDSAIESRVGQTLAERGYALALPAAVQSALASNGAVELGQISTDPARLEATRTSLGASVLVRIAVLPLPNGTWSAQVRFVAGAARGERSVTSVGVEALEQDVAVTVADLVPPARATEATGGVVSSTPAAAAPPTAGPDLVLLRDGTRLSGRVLRQEPGQYVLIQTAQGQQTVPWQEVSRVILARESEAGPQPEIGRGIGFGVGGTFADAEAKRRAWKKRGGALTSYEVRANVTGILFPNQTVPATPFLCYNNGYPSTGAVPPSETSAGGGGGGLGARAGVFYLSPPDPSKGGASFTAFRVTSGVDISYLYFAFPAGYDVQQGASCAAVSGQQANIRYESSSLMQLNVPLNLGVHFGLGGFGAGSSWSGLVVGLAYSPSYSYTKVKDATEGQGNMNWAGAELTVDVTTLEALLDEQAKEAHFRVAVFLLPPLKDGWPWLLTAGGGAVWY